MRPVIEGSTISCKFVSRRHARVAAASVVGLLLWPATAEAQFGTPPQIFCGRTYVFSKAVPDGNVIAGQATTVLVNTMHFVNRIALAGNCPAGNPTVTMTANLNCTPGPSSGPTVFGPFTLVEGFTQIPINVPIPAGPARLCDVVVTARVTFSDGSIIEQTGDQTISVQDPAAGNPTMPQLCVSIVSGSGVFRAHPGDQRTISYVLTNRHDQGWNGSLIVQAWNAADLPAVIAGPNDLRSGAWSVADPGGGDNFPHVCDADVAPGDCVTLPGAPHQTTPVMDSVAVSLDAGQSLTLMRLTRTWGLSANGAANESTALLDGTFADGSPGRAAAGTILCADTSQSAQFSCPSGSGRAATAVGGSISGVGPAAEIRADASMAGTQQFRINLALDVNRTQMLVNGVPIASATDFSGVHQIDGQHARVACDLSFINPRVPPDATITLNQSFVIQPHAVSDPTTDVALQTISHVRTAPNGFRTMYPSSIGRVDVDRTGTLVDASLNFTHQAWAVGVLNDGAFTPAAMTNLAWEISPEGADRYNVSSTWTATNPGAIPYIGFDVFNDFRAFAAPTLICGSTPGDLNGDGTIDGDDIRGHLDCVQDMAPGSACGCADMDFNDKLDGDDTALFIAALLNVPQRYQTHFGPIPATITTDMGDQPAMVEGEMRLLVGAPDAMGNRSVILDELILGTTSVPTQAGQTGGMSILLRPGKGSGTWNMQMGVFNATADLDVAYPLADELFGQSQDPEPQPDVDPHATEFFSAFVTATMALSEGITQVDLSGELTADVIESIGDSVTRVHVPVTNIPMTLKTFTEPTDCPPRLRENKRTLCLKPIFVRDNNGNNPAGSSFAALQAEANAIWAKCCIDLVWQPVQFLDVTEYLLIENFDTPEGFNERQELRAQIDPLGENDCVEVFFVEQFLIGDTGPHHAAGDGVTSGSGTKHAKIIIADAVIDDCMNDPMNPPATRLLAHEIGHALGLRHDDLPCIMSPRSTPPNCPGQYSPGLSAGFHCNKIRSPLLKANTPKEPCCRVSDCTSSGE